MTLKKVLLFFAFVLSIMVAANAENAYKQYVKAYGTGIVIASDKGLPPRNEFDKSMVDFKNGISYIKGGPGASFHIREYVRDGKTELELLNALKKRFDADKIIEGSERMVLQIWTSHAEDGTSNMDKNAVWPKKPVDFPNWREFSTMKYNTKNSDLNNNGYTWENLNPDDPENYSGGSLAKWLENAKPGYKLYILFYHSIVINYQWDAFKQKWDTMLYRDKPFAAGTIVIK